MDCAIDNRFACLTADGGIGECASGACLDLKNDPQNCGSYGFVCPAFSGCASGVCAESDGTYVCDPPHLETEIDSPTGSSSECVLESCTPESDDQLCATSDSARGFCCGGNCIPGDSEDCGGCGITCQEGSVCAGPLAGCVPAQDCPTAPANTICQLSIGGAGNCCDGACVDLSSDVHSCGTCGHAAPRGDSCIAGAPTGSCRQDADCPSGTVCAYGEACLQSACPVGSEGAECALGDGEDATHGTCCGGACVVDVFCEGTCQICPTGSACLDYRCIPLGTCGADSGGPLVCTTDAGTVGSCCGSACVDLNTDPTHCEWCGVACPQGATCDAAVCSAGCPNQPCPAGFDCVEGKCNAEICVTTGDPCAEGGVPGSCCDGQCALVDAGGISCGAVCPAGSSVQSRCLDPDSGAALCGQAGSGACPSGDICQDTVCLPIFDCSPEVAASGSNCIVGPYQDGVCCSGRCVDAATDPQNCGRCGSVCDSGICLGFCLPAGPTDDCQQTCGPEAVCLNGACIGSSCNWVGATPVLSTVESYCLAANGTIGVCCNDGACAHPQDDPQNCGSCGNACARGQACVAGMCEGSGCPADQEHEFCNLDAGPSWVCCPTTGCTDLLWDSKNCDGCGSICSVGKSCDAGECR